MVRSFSSSGPLNVVHWIWGHFCVLISSSVRVWFWSQGWAGKGDFSMHFGSGELGLLGSRGSGTEKVQLTRPSADRRKAV